MDRIRRLLPDATYATWRGLPVALRRAIAHPPAEPVVQQSVFAAYAATPLVRKLGIRAGMRVCLVKAPAGFGTDLGRLPNEVRLITGACNQPDLTLWFVRSHADLVRQIRAIIAKSADRPLWIAWPKRSAAVPSDLTQQKVRAAGLGAGLVDYKICSIDPTWSGLLFRKQRR